MDVEWAIQTRTSVKVFAEREVPREWVERCLQAAIWAPNHRLTEPWRFRVVTGDGREKLIDAVRGDLAESLGGQELAAERVERERKKIFSAPVLIAVYSNRGENPAVTRENFAATAAAVQNLLLQAHSLGLGAIWRTADYFSARGVREFLQAPPESDFVAVVYLGFPDQREIPRRRTPAGEQTLWFTR